MQYNDVNLDVSGYGDVVISKIVLELYQVFVCTDSIVRSSVIYNRKDKILRIKLYNDEKDMIIRILEEHLPDASNTYN